MKFGDNETEDLVVDSQTLVPVVLIEFNELNILLRIKVLFWRHIMLIGYVSDERYVAIPDVLLEFVNESGSYEARSRATGAIYADLSPGPYKVTLYKPGFGAKSVQHDSPRGSTVSVSLAFGLFAGVCLAQVGAVR